MNDYFEGFPDKGFEGLAGRNSSTSPEKNIT